MPQLQGTEPGKAASVPGRPGLLHQSPLPRHYWDLWPALPSCTPRCSCRSLSPPAPRLKVTGQPPGREAWWVLDSEQQALCPEPQQRESCSQPPCKGIHALVLALGFPSPCKGIRAPAPALGFPAPVQGDFQTPGVQSLMYLRHLCRFALWAVSAEKRGKILAPVHR